MQPTRFQLSRDVSAKVRKALLLRVGIDSGTGGALSPIFEDGTFEYIPIPERRPIRKNISYETLVGCRGVALATYLPRRLAHVPPHVDPDFETATYGDAAPRKRRQLSKLERNDLLVFYCGLASQPPGDRPRLFAIGYLRVKRVYQVNRSNVVTRRRLENRFGHTAHFILRVSDPEFVLVEGFRTGSRRFRRAIPLGDSCDNLLRELAPFGYLGSIRRAVGHWVRGDASVAFLEAWLLQGPPILVTTCTRLLVIPLASVRESQRSADLAAVFEMGRCPQPGDWILSLAERRAKIPDRRIVVLGRINTVEVRGGRRRARCSLFWHLAQAGPLLSEVLSSSHCIQVVRGQNVSSEAIRTLVSWFTNHYRIGRIHPRRQPRGLREIARAAQSR